MAYMELPKYLTSKEWKSQKVIVKFLGEGGTGLGKKLVELETQHGKVNWASVNPSNISSCVSASSVDEMRASYKGEFDKVASVIKAANEVEKLATTTEAKLKGAKLIPDGTAKFVGKMKSAAQTLAADLSDLDNAWDKGRQEKKKWLEEVRQSLKKDGADLPQLAKQALLKEDGAAEAFFRKFRTYLRFVQGAVGAMSGSHVKEDTVIQTARLKLAALSLDPDALPADPIPQVKLVLQELQTFDSVLKSR